MLFIELNKNLFANFAGISANQARRSSASLSLELFEQHQGTHILQSLDGFALALAADGRFLYISETVSIYLGLSQVSFVQDSLNPATSLDKKTLKAISKSIFRHQHLNLLLQSSTQLLMQPLAKTISYENIPGTFVLKIK